MTRGMGSRAPETGNTGALVRLLLAQVFDSALLKRCSVDCIVLAP